jgi:hypothetical protein
VNSDWHFIEVHPADPDGEDSYADIIHPESCGTRITLGVLPGPWVERLCGFEWEAENVGQMESLGNPEPGWYAARHWREERSTMNSAWAEVTTGIEVLPFIPPWESVPSEGGES